MAGLCFETAIWSSLEDARGASYRTVGGLQNVRCTHYRTRCYRTDKVLQDATLQDARGASYRTVGAHRTFVALTTGRYATGRTKSYRTVGELQDVRCLTTGRYATGRTKSYRTLRYRTLAERATGRSETYRTFVALTTGRLRSELQDGRRPIGRLLHSLQDAALQDACGASYREAFLFYSLYSFLFTPLLFS